ncbi:hypothetical protein YA29_16445 [Klebsiella aerogenes]|uniref:hypothetical protein n=1 Tax=Klebsiella aerogenes TaxID=548 RepID=UPI00063C5FE5|nr:hypothetical protein [Klebsiella aerogenes]KLF28676.1 hypothetical protein YA29_16445 [Klebsiella aerogenes]
MKVLFAYCHELKRSVSIDEARIEYFAIDEKNRKRFVFSCSDRQCKVAVTGVNYHVKAEDAPKFKTAHFRAHIPHIAGCEWRQFEKEREQGKRADESESDFSERQLKQLLNDYIDNFDPFIAGSEDDDNKQPGGSEYIDGRAASDPERKDQTGEPRQGRYTRTNRLQRFIDVWQDAKNTLSDSDFKALTVNVVGHGRVSYHKYVTHISNGVHNVYDGIIYGGATLVRRYGTGFLLRFFDEVNGQEVKLYVGKDVVETSRLKHYVDAILNTPDMRYFKVFLLNPTYSDRIDARGARITQLEITDLRQMVIYLGHAVKSKTEEDPISEENDGLSPV